MVAQVVVVDEESSPGDVSDDSYADRDATMLVIEPGILGIGWDSDDDDDNDDAFCVD